MKKLIYLITLLTLAWTFTGTSQAATQLPGNQIDIHGAIQSDEYIVSQSEYFFAYLHADGNFAIYKGSGPGEDFGKLWETGTHGPIGDYSLTIEDDGNVVIRTGKPWKPGHVVWTTGFQYEYTYQRYLILQDDGNFSLYNGYNSTDPKSEFVWATETSTEITWPRPKDSKYIMSDYIGDMFGYMLSNGSTLSLKDRAQKWYFTPGGEVRLKDDMTKCLSIAPGKYAHGIVVEKCNGSAVQKGWGHFYGKLRNESYPNGCVVAVKVEFMNHGARFEDRCSYNDPRIMWSLR